MASIVQLLIKHLEELSSMIRQDDVSFISQNNKCRLLFGLVAAFKQSPPLMHDKYKLSLPDRLGNGFVAHAYTLGVCRQIHRNGLGNRRC